MPVRPEIIDFSSRQTSALFTRKQVLHHRAVHIVRGVFAPNPGTTMMFRHMVVMVHEGPPVDLQWRLAGSDTSQRVRIRLGQNLISPANRPIVARWLDEMSFLAMAFSPDLIRALSGEVRMPPEHVATVIGGADFEIECGARKWRQELADGGRSGSMFAGALATVLAVHVLRTYGRPGRPAWSGGLAPARLQRVLDHIEKRLADNIKLRDLAQIAGLSTQHFGQAFRVSVGAAPHRFITDRRIERAKSLLLRDDATIAVIAAQLGFSSHGHFTTKFRALTGMTPSQFRKQNR